jgi:hypothetical protein
VCDRTVCDRSDTGAVPSLPVRLLRQTTIHDQLHVAAAVRSTPLGHPESRTHPIIRFALCRASIVITSNRIVADWGKYLRDATMGTPILDRLMHRCVMLKFEGKVIGSRKPPLASR